MHKPLGNSKVRVFKTEEIARIRKSFTTLTSRMDKDTYKTENPPILALIMFLDTLLLVFIL